MERAKSFSTDVIDYEGFTRCIDEIREEAFRSLCHEDFLHLLKFERIGRLGTIVGYATAWILPNPISALLIAQGIFTRWLLMHHISHGGYDRVPGVGLLYTSKQFAHGRRRFIDWFDWMLPDAWAFEHNVLHHWNTGEDHDPDLVERHANMLRNLRIPRPLKYLVVLLIGITWKFSYYAPSTLSATESLKNRHRDDRPVDPIRPSNFFDVRNWLVRKLWISCYLPYLTLHFVLIPSLFLPLGESAVVFVLINRILAEFITNFHTFMIIGPNHTGADLCRIDDHFKNKQEFYVNQVLASVNYTPGNDWCNYPQMWLNYQIEHHLIPNLPMTKYRQIQPKVKALCKQHNVPYLQESVFRRFRKFLRICVGNGSMLRVNSERHTAHTPV